MLSLIKRAGTINTISHNSSKKLLCSLYSYSTTTTSTSKIEPLDILIVGGGPAGLSLLSSLISSDKLNNLNYKLVESNNLENQIQKYDDLGRYDNRIISITPKNLDYLTTKINLPLNFDKITKFNGITIFNGSDSSTMSEHKPRVDLDTESYMCEIQNLVKANYSFIKEKNASAESKNPNCLLQETKVLNISKSQDNYPLVTLSNGVTYKPKLLIGCDGFNSSVKKYMNYSSIGWNYDSFGVVGNLKLKYPSLGSNLRGWQTFLTTGPLAHLPLEGDRATMVWSCDNAMSEFFAKKLTNGEVLASLINCAFVLNRLDYEYYLKKIMKLYSTDIVNEEDVNKLVEEMNTRVEQESETLSKVNTDNSQDEMLYMDEYYPPIVESVDLTTVGRFPLKMFHLDNYSKDRMVLIGDACHNTHPLAGQGLNMGLEDIKELIKQLEKAMDLGIDIGNNELVLKKYFENRYPENSVMLMGTDFLFKLFAIDEPVVHKITNIGMNFVNSMDTLKKWMSFRVSGKN
ncbi:ubiquinone biosynthesis hydrox [Hanseniaspora valbyensis NRRL Y-1626]|uniref:Ubiquinone biosynthesis hydrox n=1 Tax=Hanseniaspora valbyensis NRRL Y-1626 TaxID=766949 RepID=A0A1B7TAS0_9ASCO|nr:ubiquinone biosynthesis hydrox [Hanseniaspora valbyensis NRRL Y-1626]